MAKSAKEQFNGVQASEIDNIDSETEDCLLRPSEKRDLRQHAKPAFQTELSSDEIITNNHAEEEEYPNSVLLSFPKLSRISSIYITHDCVD